MRAVKRFLEQKRRKRWPRCLRCRRCRCRCPCCCRCRCRRRQTPSGVRFRHQTTALHSFGDWTFWLKICSPLPPPNCRTKTEKRLLRKEKMNFEEKKRNLKKRRLKKRLLSNVKFEYSAFWVLLSLSHCNRINLDNVDCKLWWWRCMRNVPHICKFRYQPQDIKRF